LRFFDVLDKAFGISMDEALAIYGADSGFERKRYVGHKGNFDFHRWSYSKDLKVRTCDLCGKSEPTPPDAIFADYVRDYERRLLR
jgi:hypothetical protein